MTDPLHEDVRLLVKVVTEQTVAIGALSIEVCHQSELHKESEKRNEKQRDEMIVAINENRIKNEDLDKRLIPVEGISKTISSIATKIIGSLFLVFILGGVSIFVLIKALGQ